MIKVSPLRAILKEFCQSSATEKNILTIATKEEYISQTHCKEHSELAPYILLRGEFNLGFLTAACTGVHESSWGTLKTKKFDRNRLFGGVHVISGGST